MSKQTLWEKAAFYRDWNNGLDILTGGYINPPWGIDERLTRDWRITHLPTRLAVPIEFRIHTLRQAKAIVAKLEALPVKWGRARANGLRGYPKEVRDAAKAIAMGTDAA